MGVNMKNEEKILILLEQMQTDISGLKEGQVRLEEETARIRQSVVRIEHEHGKKIDVLLDGYAALSEKLEPLPGAFEAVETLLSDMSMVKAVVTSHSKDINAMKNAV